MKLKRFAIAAALAAFFMTAMLCGTAFAAERVPDGILSGDIEMEDAVGGESAVISPIIEMIVNSRASDDPTIFGTEYDEIQPKPFTPPGTGTVTDNATGEDGKEFFTIAAPDGNVFYLVIDRQRNTENVYFLNAVTEADLLPLAQMPERPAPEAAERPVSPKESEPEPEPDSEPEPAPASEKNDGNTGMLVMAAAILAIGGGAGWYFKIYKPKRQGGFEEEYDGDFGEGGYDDSAYGQSSGDQEEEAMPTDDCPEDGKA